jgi:hypothetical protein
LHAALTSVLDADEFGEPCRSYLPLWFPGAADRARF